MDWEQLIEQHGSQLVLFARTWVSCHADAEDAVQSAMVGLWKKREPGKEIPLGRLFIAVKHAAIDSIRSQKRRRNREQIAGYDQIEQTAMFEPFESNSDRKTKLENAINILSTKLREVVVMKIWGEMTFKEIGESLKISQNTAAARYRYGLAALKKELGNDG